MTIPEFQLKRLQSNFEKKKITDSKSAEEYCRQFFGDDISIYESFFILLLDTYNNTIGFAKISQGGIMGTVVDVKIIMQYVIKSMASGIVLCHNHPSGNINPSKEDIAITEKLKKGLEDVCDCLLIDHIILTEKNHYSFANKGIL